MRPLVGGGLSWEAVEQWRAAPLHEAELQLARDEATLLSLCDEMDATAATMAWTGRAAEAARGERAALVAQLHELAGEVTAASGAVRAAAEAVAGVERAVREVHAFAQDRQLRIDGGVVVDLVVEPASSSAHDAAVDQAMRHQYVEECAARVNEVLARASAVDADLHVALGGIGAAAFGATGSASGGAGAGGVLLLAPPSGLDPHDVAGNAAWWSALGPGEQEQVLLEHPEWLGNRDGIDAQARDRANRLLVPVYRQQLLAEREQLLRERDEAWTSRPAFGEQPLVQGFGAAQIVNQKIGIVDAKLASLDAIDRVLSQPDHQLLSLDITRERTQAVVAVGDVSTADHVAVFTPGLTSTVDGSLTGYDQDMQHLRSRAGLVLGRHNSQETVATVTWIGYQAPQLTGPSLLSGNSVAVDGSAKDGGARLAAFLRGIDASRLRRPDLVALGHSYGSTTTGYALHEDTGVDRAGVFGSPGLGVMHADELHVRDRQTYVGRAPYDVVGELGRFGANPDFMDDLVHLETRDAVGPDGRPLHGVSGHSSYLDDDSTSQYNLAALVAGRPEDVIRLSTDPHWIL
ncbi:MAG TPA: alpha/beta hydrolase [Kineosporiaceae bacterium]|nr:alpha/beta hydrolase [Kineosporiaceae bacterium]